MKRTALILACLVVVAAFRTRAADAPGDVRLGKPKDYNGYFPMKVPASKEAWGKRRQELRTQVLVANGLWPMPERTPLKAVIHGKIGWDDYTVEKVFFASYPGHYVCGNLYRPRGQAGKRPGVLCPHGHWANGRFYEASIGSAQNDVKNGAEFNFAGAIYPLQARCVTLARMGCVVFHYDMVGYADSQQVPHRGGFLDADAELRLQSFMGLQTWNSIRALDFLTGLPDVDAKRIGVTGASGGGTQTFILCAVDDRPAAAFPAVMVSTAMQGGCICENCSLLRVGTGNIDLAALFAPKPLAMSGARDWTIDIESKGLPELKAIYRLYEAEDKVLAKCFPRFGHNYNHVSREVMYGWFNKHLRLDLPAPAGNWEKPFVAIPPKQLAVFDNGHPLPKDAVDAKGLRKFLTETSDKQLQALAPTDAANLDKFRAVVGPALHALVCDRLPTADEIEEKSAGPDEKVGGYASRKLVLGRAGQGEKIPALYLVGKQGADAPVVIWIHPAGKSSLLQGAELSAPAKSILESANILAPDVLGTGELTMPKIAVNASFSGYTFGYNRTLLANRVHDILTAVAYARHNRKAKTVHLLGLEGAGTWTLLARALCGDAVARTACDIDRFRFDSVRTTDDAMMLPGALKYGGLPAFAALCAPGELLLHNVMGSGVGGPAKAAYQAADAGKAIQTHGTKESTGNIVKWLLR